MMSGMLSLHLVLSFLSSPDPAPVRPGVASELPGGRGSTFRPSPVDPARVAPKAPVEAEHIRPSGAVAALPRLSSPFGRRGDPFRRAAAIHYGIDIPGAMGTPVLASAPGISMP
jgi:murein DD-endopeptidase MepM/ murein hydrolase activator NlpD